MELILNINMKEKSKYFIDKNGNKFWYLSNKGKEYRHKENGPAIIQNDGTVSWWFNNKLHRKNGPAIIIYDGTKEWYLNGKKLPNEEVVKWIEDNKIDLSTIEGQLAFKIRWS